jgi:hypothetical protein
MRNVLALIGLLVVGFGGIGWYLGWYKLTVERNSGGSVEFKVDVDTQKVTDDAGKRLQQAATVVNEQAGKTGQDGKTEPAPTSGTLTPSDGGWLFGPSQPQAQNPPAPQK